MIRIFTVPNIRTSPSLAGTKVTGTSGVSMMVKDASVRCRSKRSEESKNVCAAFDFLNYRRILKIDVVLFKGIRYSDIESYKSRVASRVPACGVVGLPTGSEIYQTRYHNCLTSR